MAKVKEITIDRFDLGILDQKRDLPNGYFRYLENLDIGDDVRGALHNIITSNTTSSRSLRKVLEREGSFFFLGDNGSGKVSIYKKSASTFTDATPSTLYTLTNEANPFFIIDNGYILFDNADKIGLMTTAFGSINGDFLSLTGGLKGGIIGKDGDIYGHTNNKVYRITVGDYSGSQTITDRISVPADQKIVELIPYGLLMAIICTSSTNKSIMYLWDYDDPLQFYDTVIIGTGFVSGACLLDGVITIPIGSNRDFRIKEYDQVTFRTVYYYSGRASNTGELITAISAGLARVRSYKGYMYFVAEATRPDTATDLESPVIFRYGRKTSFSPASFCIYKYFDFRPTIDLDRTDFVLYSGDTTDVRIFALVLDTTETTPDGYKEIQTSLTSTRAVDTQVGIIETGIYTLDASILKALKRVNIQLAPLPSAGKVIIKYKKDGETSWTTIMTNTTDGTISNDSVNIESTGVNLPEFNEIAFRIELSGGAEITAFKAKFEEKYGSGN